MLAEFKDLITFSEQYKTAVDAVYAEYKQEEARDTRYSDEVRAQRAARRNAEANQKIDSAAENALNRAAQSIERLRGKMQAYVTDPGDAAALQALQALTVSGVELSASEIDAFAQKGGYAILRILEKASGGRFSAPSLDTMETDLKDLESYFRSLVSYRGALCGISPLLPQNKPQNKFFSAISAAREGVIERFSGTVEKMSERWSVIE